MARAKGIRTEVEFLGRARPARRWRRKYGRADLVAGNNVYAHVPDIVGFTAGLAALVKPTGLVTLEFPHLLRLIERRQYDTIYHEHYQYLSLLTASAGAGHRRPDRRRRRGAVARTAARCGCTPGRPTPPASRPANVKAVLAAEAAAGLHTRRGPRRVRRGGLRHQARPADFLLAARAEGKTVVGYGAPGKGNTLLNHCGIRADLLAYTVDRSPHKQGMVPAGHAHPDPRTRSGSPRTAPTTSSSCRGTCAPRSARS